MKDQTYLDRESNLTPGISKISAKNVNVYYDDVQALKDVSVEIEKNAVTSFIGPSGCGKSTFLRCLNRMNDTIDICKVTGQILLEGEDIYHPKIDPVQLRAKVGMVFQKPNPFPKSVYDNIAYGQKYTGSPTPNQILMKSLKNLFEELQSGMRLRIVYHRQLLVYLGGSNNAYV